jgi:hypothetical protein
VDKRITILTVAALALVVVILVVVSMIQRGTTREVAKYQPPTTSPSPPQAIPPPTPAPVFVPRAMEHDDASATLAAEFENVAMRALYDHCSINSAWRDGSTLKGEYNHYKRDTFVTIEVDLAHPEKAGGDTLWYQVFFNGKKPARFQATKISAAHMCGLDDYDVQHDL